MPLAGHSQDFWLTSRLFLIPGYCAFPVRDSSDTSLIWAARAASRSPRPEKASARTYWASGLTGLFLPQAVPWIRGLSENCRARRRSPSAQQLREQVLRGPCRGRCASSQRLRMETQTQARCGRRADWF